MEQYYRFFTSYRRPGLNKDSLITQSSTGAQKTPELGHVIVACNNQVIIILTRNCHRNCILYHTLLMTPQTIKYHNCLTVSSVHRMCFKAHLIHLKYCMSLINTFTTNISLLCVCPKSWFIYKIGQRSTITQYIRSHQSILEMS